MHIWAQNQQKSRTFFTKRKTPSAPQDGNETIKIFSERRRVEKMEALELILLS